MLGILLRKQIIIQKLLKMKKKKLTDHNHDKCVTTSKSNTSAADVFKAR